jgi:hypothetical protein
MTTTPEASAQAPASSESPVRQKLAAAAARAGSRTRTTRPRKTTARKTTAAPKSRNDRAAARGKHSARIAPMVKSGAALLSWKNPVAGRVIGLRADAWAASLDGVAAEDPRVDAFLTRILNFAGKGGAWGDFGKESALMVGGVMVANGRVPLEGPAGMVLAMFAGGLVDQATASVATDLAYSEGIALGADPETFVPDPRDVARITATLNQERAEKAAARVAPPVVDEDQGDAPAPDDQKQVGPSVFASRWGR